MDSPSYAHSNCVFAELALSQTICFFSVCLFVIRFGIFELGACEINMRDVQLNQTTDLYASVYFSLLIYLGYVICQNA